MPLRMQAQRVGFVALLSLAFALMVFGRIEVTLVERFRTTVSDTFVPVLSFLSHPIGSAQDEDEQQCCRHSTTHDGNHLPLVQIRLCH